MVTKTKKSAGFAHVILVSIAALLAVTLIGYLAYHQVQVNKERQLFAQADKEAQAYINAIAEGYPGRREDERACSRSSAKYNSGFLRCRVHSTLEVRLVNDTIQYDVVALADKKKPILNWQETYSSVGNDETMPNEIKSYIFKLNDKSCSLRYSYKDVGSGANSHDLILDKGSKILVISAGCSGPAMAEYYK